MGNYLDHKPKLSARLMKQRLEREQTQDRAQEKATMMESPCRDG
jgi:hypothetical protein